MESIIGPNVLDLTAFTIDSRPCLKASSVPFLLHFDAEKFPTLHV